MQFNAVSLLGIPFDANSSFLQGPAEAPDVVRKILQSGSLNSSTENGFDLKVEHRWHDAGNIASLSANNHLALIEQSCRELLHKGSKVLSIGGDHSVTLPIISAYAKVIPNLSILHIDAHPDLYHQFKGNQYSNACPFARIMERKLCVRLVQVGIRTLNTHQAEQAEKFAVEMVQMKDWSNSAVPIMDGPVYLSLDVDGIDPAFAPGVSHREPGGLSSREVLTIIQQIRGPLVGADIVEFNPRKDIDQMTSQLMAKLTKEIAGKMLASCN